MPPGPPTPPVDFKIVVLSLLVLVLVLTWTYALYICWNEAKMTVELYNDAGEMNLFLLVDQIESSALLLANCKNSENPSYKEVESSKLPDTYKKYKKELMTNPMTDQVTKKFEKKFEITKEPKIFHNGRCALKLEFRCPSNITSKNIKIPSSDFDNLFTALGLTSVGSIVLIDPSGNSYLDTTQSSNWTAKRNGSTSAASVPSPSAPDILSQQYTTFTGNDNRSPSIAEAYNWLLSNSNNEKISKEIREEIHDRLSPSMSDQQILEERDYAKQMIDNESRPYNPSMYHPSTTYSEGTRPTPNTEGDTTLCSKETHPTWTFLGYERNRGQHWKFNCSILRPKHWPIESDLVINEKDLVINEKDSIVITHNIKDIIKDFEYPQNWRWNRKRMTNRSEWLSSMAMGYLDKRIDLRKHNTNTPSSLPSGDYGGGSLYVVVKAILDNSFVQTDAAADVKGIAPKKAYGECAQHADDVAAAYLYSVISKNLLQDFNSYKNDQIETVYYCTYVSVTSDAGKIRTLPSDATQLSPTYPVIEKVHDGKSLSDKEKDDLYQKKFTDINGNRLPTNEWQSNADALKNLNLAIGIAMTDQDKSDNIGSYTVAFAVVRVK